MVRRVFFSFHFERDIWRVNQVRNSWVTKPDRESAGFIDSADFEKVKQRGKNAVHEWIDEQLKNTSVTVVLIGAETSQRDYVTYEIQQSHNKNNGLLGIYIHNLKDRHGKTDNKGENPFKNLQVKYFNGSVELLSNLYPTYDWKYDDGNNNLGRWIEEAAREAGR